LLGSYSMTVLLPLDWNVKDVCFTMTDARKPPMRRVGPSSEMGTIDGSGPCRRPAGGSPT
ncbi:MAG: hypothetical protein ACC683_09765, partial [Acidimicrobiia bacterium]